MYVGAGYQISDKGFELCQHLQWHHFIHGFGQLHQKRINFDFAGQFLGKMLLIIDKWPYTVEMMTTTSKKTEALCKLFSMYSLLEIFLSDIELQFTSDSYEDQLSSLFSILSPFSTFSYSCDNNRGQYAITLLPIKSWSGDLMHARGLN